MSLFEKYGGFETVSKVVSELYDELERNDITAPYFENSDIRALMDHQVKFLSQVLGGPQYSGKAMSAAGLRSLKKPLTRWRRRHRMCSRTMAWRMTMWRTSLVFWP